jgi:hypothetical protein
MDATTPFPELPRNAGDGCDAVQAEWVLENAFRFEVATRTRRNAVVFSLLFHTLFTLTLLFGGFVRAPAPPQSAPPKELITQLFLPQTARTVRPVPSPNLSPKKIEEAAIESPSPDISNVAVDLSAIRLSFPPDVGNQLPAVVQAQGGVLALMDKENPAIARYIFRPPEWRAEEAYIDVTGKLKILMDPAKEWPVFRQVATGNSLDLDSFRACAIFDISYRRCLQTAIRGLIQPGSSGSIASARLMFRADRPCGVEVLEVSLSPAPAPSAAK